MQTICLTCNTPFEVEDRFLKYGGGRYCSRKCVARRDRSNDDRERLTIRCLNCGKEKTFTVSYAYKTRNNNLRKFCDEVCMRDYSSNPTSPGFTKVKIVCENPNCKKGIDGKPKENFIKPAYAHREGFHTCSDECRIELIKLKGIHAGENNQFWNGGKPRQKRDHKLLRNVINPIVLELFGNRSGLSGEVDSQSMPLEVHHIDDDAENNDIDNLIPLTEKEHGRTKSKYWKDICRKKFEEMMLKRLNFREFYSDPAYIMAVES